MFRHNPLHSTSWAKALLLLLAAATVGTSAGASDFGVTTGYEAGKLTVRNTITGEAVVTQRSLQFWSDSTGGQSIAPTVEVLPQQDGYDLVYTFINSSSSPRKQGQFQVGIFTLGQDISYLDGGYRGSPFRNASAPSHSVFFRFYPKTMYSPVWVIRDGRYAVGVSVQYPILEYKHDFRFAMRKSTGAYATGEGNPGWWIEMQLSTSPTSGPSQTMNYDATIPPGETRRYVVSVRITDRQDRWMQTLVPYRTFFRDLYGAVRYERRTTPVRGASLANNNLITETNPHGWGGGPKHNPDKHGWEEYVNLIAEPKGWGGILVINPTGLFKTNRHLSMPFQFTSRWLESDAMRTALDSRVGFPSLIRRNRMDLGFWWGRSVQVMEEWDNGRYEDFDPDNPRHVELALREVDVAVRAGATIIGLDTFSHNYTPTWKLHGWLEYLTWRFPQVRFVTEPMQCDFIHTQAAGWSVGWNENNPQTLEDVYHLKGPHLLADFLLPGHETWGSFRYVATQQFNLEPTPERVMSDMERYASYGFVPNFHATFSLTRDIRAAESWLTSVPEDLQIPRSEWVQKKAPTITTQGMPGLNNSGDPNFEQLVQTQLPMSGMGETTASRNPRGPDQGEQGAPPLLLMTGGNGGRGPVISHNDYAAALNRAALTRTGGAAGEPSNVKARVDDGTLRGNVRVPFIFTGRAAPVRATTRVVVGGEND
jgi:hypothetical protein